MTIQMSSPSAGRLATPILTVTLDGSVAQLWETIESLERLQPRNLERFRVSIFGSARIPASHPLYGEAQELAQRNGVCANIDFPSPGDLLQRISGVPQDPWQPDRLVWRLLEVIERLHMQPWCQPLHEHLYS